MNFSKMKKILILLLMLDFIFAGKAQDVLLEDDVEFYEKNQKFGRNRKHYYHGYFSTGVSLGATKDNKSPVKELLSNHINLGLRYKLKISDFYSLGCDIAYSIYNYRLEDDDERTFPFEKHYKKEKIDLHSVSFGLYQRFNYIGRGGRGDYIGNFLDIGVYGNWSFSNRYLYKEKFNDNEQKRKFTVYSPDFINVLNYGVLARVGYNRYVVYARYRLSELIKTDMGYSDLPPFTVGLQIGIHR